MSPKGNAVRDLCGNPLPPGGSWVERRAPLMACAGPLAVTAPLLPLGRLGR